MCWTLCSDMYHSPLGVPKNYQKFDKECSYNPKEAALMNCLADVTRPCQLGCSGLNFCTNFNNRHTELFRSCDSASDLFAKTHMQQWNEGVIKVPGIPIVVQNIKKCLPDTWKVIIMCYHYCSVWCFWFGFHLLAGGGVQGCVHPLLRTCILQYFPIFNVSFLLIFVGPEWPAPLPE